MEVKGANEISSLIVPGKTFVWQNLSCSQHFNGHFRCYAED